VIEVTKFASSTAKLGLSGPLAVVRDCSPEAGQVVIVRAKTENPNYPDLELADGTYSRIRAGDVIAGVLGGRQALRGYVGYAPYRVRAGESLHILNLGGVIGRFVGGVKDLGDPIEVEVIGCAVKGKKLLNIRQAALPEVEILGESKPIILVVGSCMNVGKTAAATEIVRLLAKAGHKVGAAKVSGVACLKDLRKFEAAGAVKTLSFLDCGVASTVDADVSTIAKTLVAHLAGADVVVMELGDGILGYYHVDGVLEDAGFMANVDAVIYCASDLVAAWGGKQILESKGIKITCVCGPATDSVAGSTYIEGVIGLPAANALTESAKLMEILAPAVTR
jgi:hypothetical protein